jgi:WD40 repeat protein
MAVAIGHATTPFCSAYPIVQVGVGSGVFGSKYSNPGALPAAAVLGAAFSPTGDYIAANTATTPFLQVWAFDIANGWGTASSNPSVLPTAGGTGGTGKQIAWRPQGDFIAMAMSSSPYIAVYAFNRATGAIGSNVCTLSGSYIPAATINGLAWSPDGQWLIGACTSSPYLYVWNFGGNGNTLINNTAAAFENANPGFGINDVCVSPSGGYMFLAAASSPYLVAYPMPRAVRNYLRIY